MKIVLGTSEWDICLNDNVRMSQILKAKVYLAEKAYPAFVKPWLTEWIQKMYYQNIQLIDLHKLNFFKDE